MDLVPKEYKKGSDIISPAALNHTSQQNSQASAKAGSIDLPKLSRRGFNYLKFGIIGSVILLFVFLAIWGGLKLYQRALSANVENLKEQEAAIFTTQDKETAEKIANLEKRAKLAQEFLRAHLYTSEILDSIAALTLPKVKWDIYTLRVGEQTVALKGQAADYSVLAKQLFAVEQTNYSNIVVSDVSLGKDGTVGFSLGFKFDPKILQKP